MLALTSTPSDEKVNQLQKCSLDNCDEWKESKRVVLKVLAVDETSS